MSFTGDLGRHSLPHLRLDMRIDEDGRLGLAEEVDEAGRDDAPLRVDRLRRLHLRKVADGHDRIAAHPDVAAEPRRTGTVDDAAVADLQIEHWTLRRGT